MKRLPLKKVSAISWGMAVLGLALILLAALLKMTWLVAVAFIILVGTNLFLFAYNRCPRCRKFLGHSGNADRCPYCGHRLSE